MLFPLLIAAVAANTVQVEIRVRPESSLPELWGETGQISWVSAGSEAGWETWEASVPLPARIDDIPIPDSEKVIFRREESALVRCAGHTTLQPKPPTRRSIPAILGGWMAILMAIGISLLASLVPRRFR